MTCQDGADAEPEDPSDAFLQTKVPHTSEQWQDCQDDLRHWAQTILHGQQTLCASRPEEVMDLRLTREHMAFRIAWIDRHVDEIMCPVQLTKERARGSKGQQYEASVLMKFLILSKEICNDSELTSILHQALRVTLPPSLLATCEASLGAQKVPSPSTLSRHTLTCDAAYSLWWRQHWPSLLDEVESGETVLLYSADATPQFGHEWSTQEITVVRDVEAVLDKVVELSTRVAAARLTMVEQGDGPQMGALSS